MKVYLIRHGEAVSSEVDRQRPLSEQGRADIRKVASFIKPLRCGIIAANLFLDGSLKNEGLSYSTWRSGFLGS